MAQTRTVGPVTKAAASGTIVAAAAVLFLRWLLSLAGVTLPDDVGDALTLLLPIAGTVVGGWIAKPKESTAPVPVPAAHGRHEADPTADTTEEADPIPGTGLDLGPGQ